MILVSACLLGRRTKYDGGANPQALLLECAAAQTFCSVCPECCAALPIPRPPSEIVGGDGADVWAGHARVVSKDGADITAQFLRGAQAALDLARKHGVRAAILKERSPSCGVRQIYDGTFTGAKRPGSGVTAALLRSEGVALYSEEDLTETRIRELLEEESRRK